MRNYCRSFSPACLAHHQQDCTEERPMQDPESRLLWREDDSENVVLRKDEESEYEKKLDRDEENNNQTLL